jgi:class 3 adenylate cyclase
VPHGAAAIVDLQRVLAEIARAAREIQRRIAARKEEADFGVGIGLHCGKLSFGEFGRSHRDLTAIGTVVNTASACRAPPRRARSW